MRTSGGVRFALAVLWWLLLAGATPAGATADDAEGFRTAIAPMYRALADLQLAAVAGAPGLQLSRIQSVVFHERARLQARYGEQLTDAPERTVAEALETAYLSFTLYGLLVGQFGAEVATQNPGMDRHFQRGVAAMETIDRFLHRR